MIRSVKILCFLMLTASVHSQETTGYLLRGKAFMDAGKFSDAAAVLTEAISRNPDGRYYEMRGDAYFRNKAITEAMSDYQMANSLIKGIGEYGLSKVYAVKGDVSESLVHLELNISSSFRKSEKEILLDPVFSLIDRTPEWRQFWKKDRYTEFETKIPEIEYYLSTGNREEANNVLSSLAADYPDDSYTQYARALINFSNQKYPEVISAMSRNYGSDDKNDKYLQLLAKAQFASGNYAGASVTYSKLIGLGLIDAGLYLKRAECYRRTGENLKARQDINRYLDLYPESKEGLSLAGKIETQAGDNLKAIDYFSRNLKIHPDDPLCFIDRANSYYVSRSWEYAISDYSMALDIDPSNSEVWLNKGVSLINLGKIDDGCIDLRKAFMLGNKKATQLISKNCIR